MVELKNNGTLSLLKELENLGLIHVQPPVSQNQAENVNEAPPSYQRLRGIHKNITGGNSVEEFLARCREDKEHELEIEKRQEKERERLAKAKLSS